MGMFNIFQKRYISTNMLTCKEYFKISFTYTSVLCVSSIVPGFQTNRLKVNGSCLVVT